MCSHLGRDWALDRPKHHTRTLSSLPKPVISLPPHPPPSVSPELWVVPGAELEALTESRLRPITCAAVAGGPRSEGPRDHTGGGQEVDAGPAPQPSLGCTHALESAQGPPPCWSCRWRQPLSHAICPRRRFSVSPQTRFSRCVHLSWGVLFIALTLYFEVLPVQVGRPALHSLDLGTGSSGRIPPPEWQRGPRVG